MKRFVITFALFFAGATHSQGARPSLPGRLAESLEEGAGGCVAREINTCNASCPINDPKHCPSCDKDICVDSWLESICCSSTNTDYDDAKAFLRAEIEQTADCLNSGEGKEKCAANLEKRLGDFYDCTTNTTYNPIFWTGLRAKACAIQNTDENQKALEGTHLGFLMDSWSNAAQPLLPFSYHYQKEAPCWRFNSSGQQRSKNDDLLLDIVGDLWQSLSKSFAKKARKTKIISLQSTPRASSYFWKLDGGELSTLLDQFFKASEDSVPITDKFHEEAVLQVDIHWLATQETCDREAPQRQCIFYDQIREACTLGCEKTVLSWMKKYTASRQALPKPKSGHAKSVTFNCVFPAGESPEESCGGVGIREASNSCQLGSIDLGEPKNTWIDAASSNQGFLHVAHPFSGILQIGHPIQSAPMCRNEFNLSMEFNVSMTKECKRSDSSGEDDNNDRRSGASRISSSVLIIILAAAFGNFFV